MKDDVTASGRARAVSVPRRFPTREVRIGDLVIGGSRPILIQSMTISDTRDTDAVVREVRTLVDAGCPLVRITAPSIADAENIREIRAHLARDGIRVPMVADIHFTPNAAMVAADIVEKVRVNPGNYADRKKFKVFEFSDAEYAQEIERIRERFLPLVRKLKANGVALRIGTNHGSLSDRIMNRFGDTPAGMVESALEFVRICRDEGYHDIVLSMKSSIPSVMIAAYRLLVQRMIAEDMDYPIHLGVTEAGNGLEGRVKSAVGIGSLLESGIGDTIRVSLTEDAHHELDACRNILEALAVERGELSADAARGGGDDGSPVRVVPAGEAPRPAERPPSIDTRADAEPWRDLPVRSDQPRRPSKAFHVGSLAVGGEAPPVVEVRVPWTVLASGRVPASLVGAVARAGGERGAEMVSTIVPPDASAEEIRSVLGTRERWPGGLAEIPVSAILSADANVEVVEAALRSAGIVDLPCDACMAEEAVRLAAEMARVLRWRVTPKADGASAADGELAAARLELSRGARVPAAFVLSPGPAYLPRLQSLAAALDGRAGARDVHAGGPGDEAAERIVPGPPIFLEAPADGASMPLSVGTALIEGIGDGVSLLDAAASGPAARYARAWPPGGVQWTVECDAMAYLVLQACRVRLTRAEFIACPSCGRTQFDLQTTTARIRARTEHLSGVKLAIMGCIVNGPGEMADADFGYVGSGRGKVDLYVGKERVEKNIPEAEAEERLIALLDEHGVWEEPSAG